MLISMEIKETIVFLLVLLLFQAEVREVAAQSRTLAGQSCEMSYSVKSKGVNRNYWNPRFTSSCQMPPKDFIVLELYLEYDKSGLYLRGVHDILFYMHPLLQQRIPEAFDMYLKNRLHRLNPVREAKMNSEASLTFVVAKHGLPSNMHTEAALRSKLFWPNYQAFKADIERQLKITTHAVTLTIPMKDYRVSESCDFYDCTQYSTCHEADGKVYCLSDCATFPHGLTCPTGERCWQPHFSVRARCRRSLEFALDGTYIYTTPENMKSVDDVMIYFYTIVLYLVILFVAVWIRRMWKRNVAIFLALKYEKEGPPVKKVLLGRVVTLYHNIE